MTDSSRPSTLTRTERLAIAGFFLVAAVISIVVVARLGAAPGDVVGPQEARPVVGEDVGRPVPVVDAIEVAGDWAREWDPEAELLLVSTQFMFPFGREQATPAADEGMVLLTYLGEKDGDAWPRLTLAVGRQSGVIYHEDEVRSAAEPPEPITGLVESLPITAEQAFRVAQEVVGEEYREGCEPSRRQVQIVLDTTQRETPRWTVVYFDERDRGTNDVVVRIDAQTGATETEFRDDITC